MTGKIYPHHTLAVGPKSRWRKYDGPVTMFYDLSNQNPLHDHELDRQLDIWVLKAVEGTP